MANEFKFEKYSYQPDPEFDDYQFIKFYHIRFNDDDSIKMVVTVEGQEFCTYTKATAITRTLKNIYDDIGTIPAVPVMVSTYKTGKGNDGYCFKDVE